MSREDNDAVVIRRRRALWFRRCDWIDRRVPLFSMRDNPIVVVVVVVRTYNGTRCVIRGTTSAYGWRKEERMEMDHGPFV